MFAEIDNYVVSMFRKYKGIKQRMGGRKVAETGAF